MLREISTIKIGMKYVVRANRFLVDDIDGELCRHISIMLEHGQRLSPKVSVSLHAGIYIHNNAFLHIMGEPFCYRAIAPVA